MPRVKGAKKQRRAALKAARDGVDQYMKEKAAAAATVDTRREEHRARTLLVASNPLRATDFAYAQCGCTGCAADGAGEDGNITKELLKHEPLNKKPNKITELALHGVVLDPKTNAKEVKAEMDKLIDLSAFFLTPASLRAGGEHMATAALAGAAAGVSAGALAGPPGEPVVELGPVMATMMNVEEVEELQISFFAGGEGAASAVAGGEEEVTQPPGASAGYGASGTGNSPVKKKSRRTSRVSTEPGPFLAANRTIRRRHPPLLAPPPPLPPPPPPPPALPPAWPVAVQSLNLAQRIKGREQRSSERWQRVRRAYVAYRRTSQASQASQTAYQNGGTEATLALDNARSAAEAAVEAAARSRKENEKQWLGGRAIGIHDEADANEAALGHEAQFNDCDESGEESDGE